MCTAEAPSISAKDVETFPARPRRPPQSPKRAGRSSESALGPTHGENYGRSTRNQGSGRQRRAIHRNQKQGSLGDREAGPPHRRQPSDCEGRRRCPRAGLHRGHAGLEKRRRAPPRHAHRAHGPGRAQGGQMELALLWHRWPGLVPQLPYLHELRQGDLLPRHVAATRSTGRQGQGRSLDRHPRGRSR
jgi:hypothetical protein